MEFILAMFSESRMNCICLILSQESALEYVFSTYGTEPRSKFCDSVGVKIANPIVKHREAHLAHKQKGCWFDLLDVCQG